jgi:hypothetical protein
MRRGKARNSKNATDIWSPHLGKLAEADLGLVFSEMENIKLLLV